MKTILVFSWFYLPYVGGAELFVKAMVERLSSRFRFVIVTARADRRLPRIEESDHARVVRVGVGRGVDKFLYPLPALARALALPRVDLVHAIMVNAAAVAAYGYTRLRSRPSLLTLQEGDSEDYVKRWLGPAFTVYPHLHRPFDRIHAISHFLKDQAVRYGADRDTIRVIPNGVATRTFRPLDEDQTLRERAERLRESLGLAGKRGVISVSRLVEKNGIDTLIEAFRRVSEGTPDARLLLVGDGPERSALEARVAEIGLTSRVHFTGTVEHEATAEYLRLSDVFARPSKSEGLGTAFLEAMACAVPVVATPVGGIPDFLEPEANGLLVPPGDSQELAAAIARLLADAELRNRLAGSALALVRERYTWERVAEEIGQMYDVLLSRPRS